MMSQRSCWGFGSTRGIVLAPRLRLKLAAALSIPLFALGVVTVLEVVKSIDDGREVREQTDLAISATGPSGVITALQNERTWPGIDLVGLTARSRCRSRATRTRAATDEAIRQFRDLVTSKGGAIAAAYVPALDQLDQLQQLRRRDRRQRGRQPRAQHRQQRRLQPPRVRRVHRSDRPDLRRHNRISLAINDSELRQGTELADAAARQVEVIAQLASSVIHDVTAPDGTGLDTTEKVARAATFESAFIRHADTMRNATGVYADIAAEAFPAQLTDDLVATVDTAIAEGRVELAVFGALNAPPEDSYGAYQEAVADQIEAGAQRLATRRGLEPAGVVHRPGGRGPRHGHRADVVGAAVDHQAVAVADPPGQGDRRAPPPRRRHRHPRNTPRRRRQVPTVDPVVVHTRDEVADVSLALNTVQDTALDLAVEQAVLRRNIADSFVNLGRRNQNLLGRQLDFITELETNETDPDTLSNLFRLDHLATRMRRNAESLLRARRHRTTRKWAAPVRLTDVIRAALGEVEDYQRVTVRGVEPATIIGNAAADLAHLLAGVIGERPRLTPDQTVDIRGRPKPQRLHPRRHRTSGLGMPQTDIPGPPTAASPAPHPWWARSSRGPWGPSSAGHLAARHDVHVTLDNSPGNGVAATIDLPPPSSPPTAPCRSPTAPRPPRRVATRPGPRRAAPRASPGPGVPHTQRRPGRPALSDP